MTVGAEYSASAQAKIPCALAAVHNFICIHDLDDFADGGNGDWNGPCNPNFTLRDLDGDNRIQFDEAELGRFISQEEKEHATIFQDDIATRMWEDYIANGSQNEPDI